MPAKEDIVDVVGVGLNATDVLIRLPHFPAFNSKVRVLSTVRLAGGQVASALVACRRWGLRTRYIGSIGDDDEGKFQRRELEREGVDAEWLVRPGARSQFAYILIDEPSGERTILWGRDPALEIRSDQLDRHWIERARLLHVDAHDVSAAIAAAGWARAAGIPVTADIDNCYPGVEDLLGLVDHLLVSADFPARLLGNDDPLETLPLLAARYGCRVTGVTMGEGGAIGWEGQRFCQSPAYVVDAIDTTGAGDIFHGAYAYAFLAGWDLQRRLDFACAAAGLNCTALGARGGIRPLSEILSFMDRGPRRAPAFSPESLARAAAARRE